MLCACEVLPDVNNKGYVGAHVGVHFMKGLIFSLGYEKNRKSIAYSEDC